MKIFRWYRQTLIHSILFLLPMYYLLRLSNVTYTIRFSLVLTLYKVSANCSLTFLDSNSFSSSSAFNIGVPLTAIITSPSLFPSNTLISTFDAGESLPIDVINAPSICCLLNDGILENIFCFCLSLIIVHPKYPRLGPPRSFSNISRISRFISSHGIAKPIPALLPDVDIIAVFTPIHCPFVFNNGPPEFPGLIAASVCIQLDTVFDLVGRFRFNAETTPDVTVWSNPNGFPIAIPC